MARPRNADGQRTRQAILDAALRLFAEKGYFGTTLRDVAAAVGLRESALYNYFAGKHALFEALIGAEQTARSEHVAALLDRPVTDVRAELEGLATRMLDGYVTPAQSQLFCILMSDGLRLAREGRINLMEKVGTGRPRLAELMRHLIKQGGLRPGDPQQLALSFLGPLLLWRHLHAIDATHPQVANRRAFVKAHVQQFLSGAAAPGRLAALPRRPMRPQPRRAAKETTRVVS